MVEYDFVFADSLSRISFAFLSSCACEVNVKSKINEAKKERIFMF
jgi:hypothetical protein